MREYFCAYHSMLNGTRKLSDAECGRLFRALLCYSAGADVGQINLQGREEVLFDVYSQQIDRDAESYEKKVSKSRENGGKGGRPKKNQEVIIENLENPQVFSETQKTQDKDEDKDEDKEKDEDKDKYTTCGGIDTPDAADADDDRPDFNTIEVYATNNLTVMTAGNMAEFADFKEQLPEELIRHAIDEAGAQGKRTWSYVRSILRRYIDQGHKTVVDVQAAHEEFVKKKGTAAGKPSTNQNFQQRTYTDDDFKYLFYDPAKDYAHMIQQRTTHDV